MKEKIQDAYMDYVLTHGKEPHSVYVFAKELAIKEADFYEYYNSFESVGMDIWESFFTKTKEMIEKQEVWNDYSVRERLLSFFYSFCELLKSFRSYASYSFKPGIPGLKEASVLTSLKKSYFIFIDDLISRGLDTHEILDRKFLTDRYRDGLWTQFIFLVQFWLRDNSVGFEKTDEAIEKGVNLSFDLMARSPLDSLLDYTKFILRNRNQAFDIKVK
jgi:Tetracyclin repressor-like, C-terminal domain